MTSSALFEQTYARAPTATGYAPGRIEVIGNHTDYNGGCVLGAAIDRGIWASVAPRSDRGIRLISDASGVVVSASLDELIPRTGSESWVNYPLGVLAMAQQEGLPFSKGFDFAAVSNLPVGAGMSSSAALEVATLRALASMHGCEEPDPAWAASLCRKAENDFVGMPCGLLDQTVSVFGKAGHLVHLDCQGEVTTMVRMPSDAYFWVFDSHKQHALIDSKYAERHRQCREAFSILRKYDSVTPCLARMKPELVEKHSEELGPDRTHRAQHVTEENLRVARTREAIEAGDLATVGSLLLASHHSSCDLFENSVPELDFLVDQLTSLPSVYGARLTGGGFGGSVMALTDASFGRSGETDSIAAAFRARFGRVPSIFQTVASGGATVVLNRQALA